MKKSRNVSASPSPIEDKREEILSEEEVFDWLNFAQELSNQTGFPFTGMPLTPQMVNSRMKDITLNTIGGITEEKINQALSNPKTSETELLNMSESFEISSMPYRRIINYQSNLLAWDMSYSCANAKSSDYSSAAYKKDLDVLKEFTQKFDYKSEFKNIVLQMFREEMYFGVLRDEGNRWTMQQLPSQKCLVTGRWENGLLFSFDYSWFLNSGVDIAMYPDVFKRTYSNLIIKNGGTTRYIPSLPVEDRMNSAFVWWGDCSPVDNFWGFKLSPQIAARVPFFSSMFPDLVLQPLVRGLQKNSLMASAVRLILGNLPMLKDTKSKVSDMFALDAPSLAKFLKLIQSAINSESVRIASAPLEQMQAVEFKPQTDLYSSYIKTTLGTSGINGNLLFSADVKPNVEETRLSVNVDEMISFGLYNYFNRFVEYHVNKKTNKFKFLINFEGSNFYSDRERRWTMQKDNISYGIINVSKIAAAQGQDPFVFQAQLEESKALGFVDKLTPIVPAAQLSADASGNSGAGRPTKKDGELSESGSETRQQGSNTSRGGKV